MSTEIGKKELSARAQHLFRCLVERYVADGQPVGSRTLARDAKLELSPATIRNVMADLEDLGLIHSPHTSAGRVPTVRGYRLFVDSMLTFKDPAPTDLEALTSHFSSEEDVHRLLQTTSELLSQITRFAGLVMIPRTDQRAFRQVEFLPLSDNRVLVILVINEREVQNRVIQTARAFTAAELQQAANYLNSTFAGRNVEDVQAQLLRELRKAHDEMNRMMQAVIEVTQKALAPQGEERGYLLAGQTNLMEISELSNIEKLRQLFDAFTEKRDILHLLDQAMNARGVQIFIGEESGYGALDECSVVTSTYEDDDHRAIGVLGVIGPTRMEYERVIPIVSVTARMLSTALKSLN